MDTNHYRHWPDDETKEFIHYWAEELEKYSSAQILQWAYDTYYSRLAVISTFGLGGACWPQCFTKTKSIFRFTM
jgi:hypothetical protein